MSQPFNCTDCAPYPDSAFHIFKPANDWIITFPEQRLFHLHFGEPAFPDSVDTLQAEDAARYYFQQVHAYPDQQFFYMVDMSRVDNSGFISNRARQIYQILVQHPQLVSGVAYGATTDMQAMLSLLAESIEQPVRLVHTKAQADAVYQTWFNQQSKI